MTKQTPRVLAIHSSARHQGSSSRELSSDLIAALEDRHDGIELIERDLGRGLPFVDDAWVEANFTPEESRTQQHRETLSFSDELVDELQAADIIVIGTPMYNFSIPAALKAWVDMVARARRTFKYTQEGPVGLLKDKTVFLVVATGGVPVGSPVDFATPYLKHALAFLGITDVKMIAADQLNSNAAESMDLARAKIAELVHLPEQAA